MTRRKVPVVWNGIEYESITAAAQAHGITTSTMKERVDKGYTCDVDVLPVHNKKRVVWNGIEYESITAAAQAHGITTQAMSLRLKKRKLRKQQ